MLDRRSRIRRTVVSHRRGKTGGMPILCWMALGFLLRGAVWSCGAVLFFGFGGMFRAAALGARVLAASLTSLPLIGARHVLLLVAKMKAGASQDDDLAPRSRPEASAIHSRTAPVSDPHAAGGGLVFARAAEAALAFTSGD